ncbi:MAG: NADH-quinone oxidoreductase subunit H [Candidatus Omnitrophica bacterium]|nr:NADH-quinone oxidoreductase subunit H [Candidatus Omnitrophota bacterium]
MFTPFLHILVFPGFLFLVFAGLIAEYIDRKLYARLQNRVGPPFFQPLADFIKLTSKEDIVPEEANPRMFKAMPIFALTATVTAIFYIPLWSPKALYSFNGDLIVVMYLLTIPTLTYFLGGWYSTSLYSKIGAVRSLTQLFAYEVPLLMCILAPALLANTWSLSEMASFYENHSGYWLFNIIGFAVAIVALLGKLEKVPFDIPEAETEIVAGTFTEYSGRLFGIFRLSLDIEAIVGSSLIASVYLPFGFHLKPLAGFLLYMGKVLSIIAIMSLSRSIFARLRIDQMINFCWKYLSPLAFLQILICLIAKWGLYR